MQSGQVSDIKIGVISDTHYTPARGHFPFDVLKRCFADVSLIIHAGDITSMAMLNELNGIAPVEAVCGNMDPQELCTHLPDKKVIHIAHKSIGIIHGSGSHSGLPDRLFDGFKGEKPDIIVFGHTHHPYNETVDGTLCFNPGSPVKPSHPAIPTVGIITISDEGKIAAKILQFK